MYDSCSFWCASQFQDEAETDGDVHSSRVPAPPELRQYNVNTEGI